MIQNDSATNVHSYNYIYVNYNKVLKINNYYTVDYIVHNIYVIFFRHTSKKQN